jgi:hypothetical protein
MLVRRDHRDVGAKRLLERDHAGRADAVVVCEENLHAQPRTSVAWASSPCWFRDTSIGWKPMPPKDTIL